MNWTEAPARAILSAVDDWPILWVALQTPDHGRAVEVQVQTDDLSDKTRGMQNAVKSGENAINGRAARCVEAWFGEDDGGED